MPLQVLILNYDDSDTFLIYSFKQISLWRKKLRNYHSQKLEIWRYSMISLYIKLCTCVFGGDTSRVLGQTPPKLVIAKFIK